MLIKEHTKLEAGLVPRLEKWADGVPANERGAFPCGTVLRLRFHIPRGLGVAATVLRIAPDGGEGRDYPFSFVTREGSEDLYELTLDSRALCGEEESGLFFYEFLFLRGVDTLFSESVNNVDFTLSPTSGTHFRLLIHEADFHPPRWFMGGTMYHVFVDRFFRGEGPVVQKESSEINPDWENGIPQYAQRSGEPLSNHVFFGGNLWGVAQKLDHLEAMGITVLYLSPIFEAYSNHRYDTADYERIDGLLGGEEAFDHLLAEAHKRGIRVILDGVFNHTGDDSVYFNRKGTYPGEGAYQSRRSPYADWFHFKKFPTDYESWWGIEIMPRLQHANPKCRRYFTGEEGIGAKWIRRGIDGWRLDVADELNDDFLNEFRATVKAESGENAIIIGEVWENAVDKVSYGRRRKYFRGGQLDSVMNYPFRNAVLAFLLEGDALRFYHILTELYGTYPLEVSHSLMNLLGTHDTERFLTRLGEDPRAEGKDNAYLSTLRLSKQRRALALERMKVASILQFTVFGVPSIYYGDEVGLEGHHDPFCRMPYPWGREEKDLQEHYRRLGALRREHAALCDGSFRFVHHDAHSFAYLREKEEDRVLVAANQGKEPFVLPLSSGKWINALQGGRHEKSLTVPPATAVVLTWRRG